MNKFLKYFLILLTLVLVVGPILFATQLYKSSESAFEKSQDKNDAQRQSNLRDSKVNPEKQPISILFLGIDDNEGREKNGQSIEHSRSDAMILSTFNQKSIKLECLVSHEIQLVIYLKLVITIKLHMRMLMVAQLLQWIQSKQQ